MLLHGMKDTEFEIFHGDTLENSWSLLNEMNPSKKTEFDAIVANPPFSLRWEPNAEDEVQIDLNDVYNKLTSINESIKTNTDKYNEFLKELGLKPI